MALTVGVATVLEAREVVVVVTGQRKSLALSKGMCPRMFHVSLLTYLSDLGRCEPSHNAQCIAAAPLATHRC
jgi:hypothetical protein